MTVSVAATILSAAAAMAAPVTYDGILFPGGDASFADAVVDSRLSPGTGPATNSDATNPNSVLGAPDFATAGIASHFSLGADGFVTVQFTDNSLTTSGDSSPDLFVFEAGMLVEPFSVAISTDGMSFIDIGTVLGQPTSLDIDGVAGVMQGARYSFVRVMAAAGADLSNFVPGADIDAIGAISSAAPVDAPPVPLPAAGWMLLAGVGGLYAAKRRRR